VGTSAHKSGQKPPVTALEAIKQIGGDIDVVLDGGPCPIKVSSTVVDLTLEKPRLLRAGPIGLEEVLAVVEKVS